MDLSCRSDPAVPAGTSAARTIRGQDSSPGPGAGLAAHGGQVAVGASPIRGPTAGPGATEVGPLSRAQMRLNAKNSHLWRSFDDHADRVARRKAACQDDGGAPSAAERLAALRQRVMQRAGSSGEANQEQAMIVEHLDQGGGEGGGEKGHRNTIEVSKIQLEGGEEVATADADGTAHATAAEASKTVAARRGREDDASLSLGMDP